MPRIRYVGPVDAVDIPLLRLNGVKRGDVFDATDDQAASLLLAPDNYEPAPAKATAKADTALIGEAGPEAVVPPGRGK